LTTPSQPISAPICGWLMARPTPMNAAPRAMLVAGPASAMSASSRGERASASMVVAPPKMNSVMPFTFRPSRRATSACDISCARTEPKKRTAVAPATSQYWPPGQPGNWRGNWDSASEYVRMKAITSHEG